MASSLEGLHIRYQKKNVALAQIKMMMHWETIMLIGQIL